MKNPAKNQAVAGAVAFGLGLFGCAHAQTKALPPDAPPVATAAPAPKPVEAEAVPKSTTDADLAAVFSGDVLHFGLDEANLTPQSRARLQAIAEVLGRNPDVKIRIDGNCDERGTEEYNLQLGDRRAAVAKEYLGKLGIAEGRIAIVSYGKDRPVATAHDEQAWSQNRRDDFHPASTN